MHEHVLVIGSAIFLTCLLHVSPIPLGGARGSAPKETSVLYAPIAEYKKAKCMTFEVRDVTGHFNLLSVSNDDEKHQNR